VIPPGNARTLTNCALGLLTSCTSKRKPFLEERRQLLGSIFPENLVFDGIEVRTARLNEGVDLIYQISSKLQGKKNGTNPFKLDLSREVHPEGQKSNLLLEDLRKLARLFEHE
jgi:site-specific DNA recombinase